ncbi:MAG: tRNA (adenosine(37)-N6)-threonylcarbamoyltransferase complex transferase subunit TsaD [Candidatus Paceibacterota bacterium]
MKLLSIETSCDETSFALIDIDGSSVTIHAHEILSQIDIHREYGGVFPSLAKREHAQNAVPLIKKTLEKTALGTSVPDISQTVQNQITELLARETGLAEALLAFLSKTPKPNIDAVAVTHGPGLEPTLWVGINLAKSLSAAWQVPVIPVNHMEGHISSLLIEDPASATAQPLRKIEFPALALLVSGGHTELVFIKAWGDYSIIGQTVDDAAGEAFDKVARLLGLPYPGGPEISKLATQAREDDTASPFALPRPMLNSGDLNFSFSGIKTAVRNGIENIKIAESTAELTDKQKQGISREFEDAVVETLLTKTERACDAYGASSILIAGGVAANTRLISSFKAHSGLPEAHIASRALTGDNALMIALAGWIRSQYDPSLILQDPSQIQAIGNLSLEEKRIKKD